MAPEDEDQGGQRHRPDAQRLPVRMGPGAGGAGGQAGGFAPRRSRPRPEENAERVRTAAADGPVKNAPAATIRPTTSRVRSAVFMNRTRMSNAAAAASADAVAGTLFR